MPSSVDKSERTSGGNSHRVAFDRFELDLRSGELRKDGRRIRLQAQPFQLLAMLIENAGEAVTRDEVCRALWQTDTFVDFDHSVAAAVSKIREALDDSAENPRFVETLPKRGYRFIGKIKPEGPVVMAVAKPQQSVELVPVPAAKAWSGGKWTLGLAGVAVVVAAAVLFVLLARKRVNSKLNFQPNSQPITAVPFTSYPGVQTTPSFSPDGSRIAFSWDNGTSNRSGRPGYDLYVKAIGSETVLRLTHHPSDWISSTWSPDGTQIAFHRMAGTETGIYVVPALGGPERKLKSTRVPYSVAAPISWSPDGKWIGFGEPLPDKAEDRVFLLSVDTLETRALPHDPRCLHEATPTFSHSGNELAYVCVCNTNEFELHTMSPTGSAQRRIATFSNFTAGFQWSEDDRRFILSEWTENGPELYEIKIADGAVQRLTFAPNATWPDISARGHKLAYSAVSAHRDLWRKDLVHPEAPAIRLLSSTRDQDDAQYSPDGRHVAFESTRAGVMNVWMSNPDGTNLIQISNLESSAGTPRWSPDGSRLAFDSHQGDHYDIYVVDVAERVPRKLQTNARDVARPSWSHDGKWIYFRSYEAIGHKIYRCPATGGDATVITTSPDGTFPQESFDGEELYFAARNVNTGLRKVALKDGFADAPVEGLPVVLNQDLWTIAPHGIYFVAATKPKTLEYYDFATKTIREIFKVEKEFDSGLSVSPDGRYLLYSQVEENNADIMVVNYFH